MNLTTFVFCFLLEPLSVPFCCIMYVSLLLNLLTSKEYTLLSVFYQVFICPYEF